jgi:ElaB/YqjD/DUF883 family membrane-anchored ribosome-binding protein
MATPNYGSTGTQSSRTSTPEPTDTYEALKGDIASLTDSVKKLATEHMGSAVEGAQDQVKQKLGDMESSIRKNPTQAALIAAGVGFLVGLVITR